MDVVFAGESHVSTATTVCTVEDRRGLSPVYCVCVLLKPNSNYMYILYLVTDDRYHFEQCTLGSRRRHAETFSAMQSK